MDFEKVYRNVDEVKIELNILNSLVGSKDIKTDLVDYVTGVETGLDSNGRKNRGGHLYERFS